MQIVFFLLATSLISCATTELSQMKKPLRPSVVATKQKPEVALMACSPSNLRCPKATAPTFCYADISITKSKAKPKKSADQKTVKATELVHLYAWGNNRCSAMNSMNSLFCKKNLNTPQKVMVSCQPDASNGHCPAKELDCSDKLESTTCFAGYYGTQLMSSAHAITTKGRNDCEARNKLYKEACRKNLDPLMLKRINCEVNLSKSDEK